MFRYKHTARINRLLSTSFRLHTPKQQPANENKSAPEKPREDAVVSALRSMKDMKSIFSSSNEDEDQPIDSKPIFENPRLFVDLSLLHQGQVIQELQEKYNQKWTKLTPQDKRLGYFIAYGDWGVREKFTNWNTQEPPLDLSFAVPSQIRKVNPQPQDPVHKLEPVKLADTEVRKEQFDTSKTDPVTKTFIYITAFVVLFALARDKKIGEAGKPKEVLVEDQYPQWKKMQEEKQEQERLAEIERNRRKWYYLWLK